MDKENKIRGSNGRFLKGHPSLFTKETRLKISHSLTKIGHKPPTPKKGRLHHNWKGGKPKCKCGKRIHYGNKTCIKCRDYKNEKNPSWKGGGIDYSWLHKWIRREWGIPKQCEYCKKIQKEGKRIQWANISGKYLRQRMDWVKLCSSCHIKLDRYKNTEIVLWLKQR